MADSKITALTALTAADPVNDMFPVVDVSDTTMAASGTTKKISVNNILGASGTATLASATITGAATVGTTLGVTGALTCQSTASFFTGTGLPLHIRNSGTSFTQIGDNGTIGAGTAFVVGSSDASLRFQCGGAEQMRLNSTGLGIGGSVTNKLTVNNTAATGAVSFLSTGTTTAYNLGQFSNTGGSLYFGVDNSAGSAISGATAYGSIVGSSNSTNLHLITNNTVRATVDTSGNLMVGTTTAFSALTGSNQLRVNAGGLQTLSQAISAGIATDIATSGLGGLAVITGNNATGQYSALVLFNFSSGATIVSVQNATGSVITYGISGGRLQVTSSLPLTTLITTCIRV